MAEEVPKQYWQNLLAISTKAQVEAENEGNHKEEIHQLNETDRQFIEEAMKATVQGHDPSRIFTRYMKSLNEFASSVDNLSSDDQQTIEDIADRVEDLISLADLSPVFINNGGIYLLETFIFKCKVLKIRALFAQLILPWAENFPTAQKIVIDSGIFDKLVELIQNPKSEEQLISSSLSAISATTRSNIDSFKKFKDANCPEIFFNLVKNSKYSYISRKAARILTMISETMQDYEEWKSYLINYVIDSYIHLAQIKSYEELDFLRNYLVNRLSLESINSNQRENIYRCLKLEKERNQENEENNFNIDLNTLEQALEKFK